MKPFALSLLAVLAWSPASPAQRASDSSGEIVDAEELDADDGVLGAAQPLTFLRGSMDVQIEGPAYQATLETVYRNPRGRTLEGVVFLPIAADAAPLGFVTDNNGLVMVGRVRDRQRGLDLYRRITRPVTPTQHVISQQSDAELQVFQVRFGIAIGGTEGAFKISSETLMNSVFGRHFPRFGWKKSVRHWRDFWVSPPRLLHS